MLGLLLAVAVGGSLFAQSHRRVHVVQAGETLYRIGRQYGVTVAELYRLNPSARQGIRPGEQLILPQGAVAAGEAELFYDVKRGDTLYSIARRAGSSVRELMSLNPFLKSPDDIAAGMILRLPSGAMEGPEKQVEPVAADSLHGVRMVTVQPGTTVFSLVKGSSWTEEDFYRFNPQVRQRGLQAGEAVFLPDGSIRNNLAARSSSATRPSRGSGVLDVVLALPFKQDRERRFADYYEGFLLSVLEEKRAGRDINLYVYSSDEEELPATKEAVSRLDEVDLIIGGVSAGSIRQLSELAKYKQAAYVVPFSARDLTLPDGVQVYQVNTPARILYDRAAEKFAEAYASYHVLFAGAAAGEEESPFVQVLRNRLTLSGASFSECSAADFATAEDALRQTVGRVRLVVVPASSSLAAARRVLSAIREARKGLAEGMVLTAFGYPEWQTYASSLGRELAESEAAFFTTFYVHRGDRSYRQFSSDYMRWYGHSTGNTFPQYSALGYDTGRFFLEHAAGGAGREPYRGVQSLFDYTGGRGEGGGVRSNGGVFFVRFGKDNSISRF